MGLLENDAFLNELTKMFLRARESGSVTLTMKRYDGRDRHLPQDGSKNPKPEEYMCLLRATLRKQKISTVVEAKDVHKFQQAYCSLLRGNMDGLKKLKKTKMKSKTT